MRSWPPARWALRFIGVSVLGGCASQGPSAAGFTIRQIEGADRAVAFRAGERALLDLGYRIEEGDESVGILTTQPIFSDAPNNAAPARFHLSSKSRFRRIVHLRLASSADAVSVACKVVVQRRTTEVHRMFAHDRGGYDAPAETPIDRDAATTGRQNDVWQIVRRDKPAERAILAAVLEQAAATPASK